MARRDKTSPAEDLMEIVSLLPWWVGILLALGSYLLLHHWAAQPLPAVTQPAQIGAAMTRTFWRGLAFAGQYILPVICLVGAGVSAWKRRQRGQLVANATQSRSTDALQGLTWQDFEKLVGEGFRLRGYRVAETGGGGADGGVDLVLSKGSEKFLVQCKQWRAFKVGVSVVRELYGVMAARGAAGGFVVTSGRFTEEATTFAKGRNLSLIDGPDLMKLINAARSAEARPASSPSTAPAQMPPAPASVASPAQQAVPACPLCAKPMVRRVAKRGSNVGGEFWGCSGYPGCRGTKAIG